MTREIPQEAIEKVAEAVLLESTTKWMRYMYKNEANAIATVAIQAAIEYGYVVVKTVREAVSLDDIQVGDCIEYQSGWIAKVFDVTNIVWIQKVGGGRSSARIWSRADGREWYHTHRRDGVSTTDGDCDIKRIIKAHGDEYPPTKGDK